MTDPIARPGGHALWNTNQRIDSTDLTNASKIALATLCNLFISRLFSRDYQDAPVSGCVGQDLLCEFDSVLDITVRAGVGFYLDTTDTDDFGPIYKPVVVASDQTETLSAHDGSNPRIDIISIAPNFSDDISSSEDIFDGISSFTPTAVNTRTALSYTLTVTEGTPAATPSRPSTPAGNLLLAECLVPASSGDPVVTDLRPELTFSQEIMRFFRDSSMVRNFVPGTGTELEVTANGVDMDLTVSTGKGFLDGYPYEFKGDTTLTASANSSGVTRYDQIVVNDATGLLEMNEDLGGISAAQVEAAGTLLLAYVAVPNGATSISTANDLRVRYPLDNTYLEPNSLTTDNIDPSTDLVVNSVTIDSGENYTFSAPIPRNLDISSLELHAYAVSGTYTLASRGSEYTFKNTGSGSSWIFVPFDIMIGATITSVFLLGGSDSSTGTPAINSWFLGYKSGGNPDVTVASSSVNLSSVSTTDSISVSETVLASRKYYIFIDIDNDGDAANNSFIRYIRVTYNHDKLEPST